MWRCGPWVGGPDEGCIVVDGDVMLEDSVTLENFPGTAVWKSIPHRMKKPIMAPVIPTMPMMQRLLVWASSGVSGGLMVQPGEVALNGRQGAVMWVVGLAGGRQMVPAGAALS